MQHGSTSSRIAHKQLVCNEFGEGDLHFETELQQTSPTYPKLAEASHKWPDRAILSLKALLRLSESDRYLQNLRSTPMKALQRDATPTLTVGAYMMWPATDSVMLEHRVHIQKAGMEATSAELGQKGPRGHPADTGKVYRPEPHLCRSSPLQHGKAHGNRLFICGAGNRRFPLTSCASMWSGARDRGGKPTATRCPQRCMRATSTELLHTRTPRPPRRARVRDER